MSNYRVLNHTVYTQDKYAIVPVRYEDRLLIMKWRNEQIYHLRQVKPLTEEDQDKYFKETVSVLFHQEAPEQILFSYLEGGNCIGYGGLVHINWTDHHGEISFVLNTDLEKEHFHKHWRIFLSLLEQVAFTELSLHKIFTYAFDLRPYLYEAIEAIGYKKEAVLNDHCFFNGSYRDVIIHSKFNNSTHWSLRSVERSDIHLLFNWANDPDVRQQSFNNQLIFWDNHVKWFNSRVDSSQCFIYILEMGKRPVGQIRVEVINDKWMIDYSVDSKYRAKGFGKILINHVLATHKGITIWAVVKKGNLPSIRVFEQLGFKRTSEDTHTGAIYFNFINS